MESSLTKAYTIRIQNFEGPFDLLFHLIEKNQVNLYDIPINEITDQYMDYLFAMQQLDLELASEFLVMAATLLHIKSKMLLPEKKEKTAEEQDPREELVARLIKYKKYKEFSLVLKDREKDWEKVFYKLPELIQFNWKDELMELAPEELTRVYIELLERNRKKINTNVKRIDQIIEHEKISLRSKIREVIRLLAVKTFFRFSELFSPAKKSKVEVVTGFLAVLELSKMKKARLEQKHMYSDIMVYRNDDGKKDNDSEMAVDA